MKPLLMFLLFCHGAAAGAHPALLGGTVRRRARRRGCHEGDPELARWALEAWQAASDGALHLEAAPKMENAQIRVFWANGRNGLYGEARPIVVDGIRGAEVYVLPEQSEQCRSLAARRCPLPDLRSRDRSRARACGIPPSFADIMYSFQFGGDIEEYFGRYRRLLNARADIRKHAGISEADRKQLRELWK